MAIFAYQARNTSGATEKGVIEAGDRSMAIKELKGRGVMILALDESSDKSHVLSLSFRKRVRLQEKVIFSRQLSVMIKAGLPLVKAIEALEEQSENQYFKSVLKEIIQDIEGGQPLSKALTKHPKVFSEIEIAVMRAGEQTGKLSDVLLTLAQQQEKDAELQSKIKGAMIYPAVIFTALIGVVILVIFMVLPSLEKVFADVGSDLPLQTRILLGTSSAIRRFAWLIVLVIVGGTYLIRMYCRTDKGRHIYDISKLKVPVFGSLTRRVYMARFSRTMAMMTKSSLPILQSIEIVRKTISNSLFEAAFTRIEESVRTGHAFSEAIRKEKMFPAMVSQLSALGEQSGTLDEVMLEVADFYDKEIDQITKNLTTLLEPFLLIVMGIGVAFVATAVLGPIYSLAGKF